VTPGVDERLEKSSDEARLLEQVLVPTVVFGWHRKKSTLSLVRSAALPKGATRKQIAECGTYPRVIGAPYNQPQCRTPTPRLETARVAEPRRPVRRREVESDSFQLGTSRPLIPVSRGNRYPETTVTFRRR
jgi:hypothetical protein